MDLAKTRADSALPKRDKILINSLNLQESSGTNIFCVIEVAEAYGC
jgi:hypothetical protein